MSWGVERLLQGDFESGPGETRKTMTAGFSGLFVKTMRHPRGSFWRWMVLPSARMNPANVFSRWWRML